MRFPSSLSARKIFAAGLSLLVLTAAAAAQTDKQKQPAPGAATPTQPAAGQAEPRPAWTMNCGNTDQGLDCRVVQSLFLRNTGKRLLSVVVHVPPDTKKPLLLLQLPLGIYLPAGARFQIGKGEGKNVPFKSCDQFGCLAEYAITDAEISAMSKGQDLAVTMVNLRNEPVTVTVPSLGFADAYAKVK
jgi:invasion protein IalB